MLEDASRKNVRELNIEEQQELNHNLAPTKAAKEMKLKAKSEGLKNLKLIWEEQSLPGQYPLRANNADRDRKKTHQWLRCTHLPSNIRVPNTRPK